MATDRENYISNNNIITLHRGDTFNFELEENLTLEGYDSTLDHVYLGFMEPNQRWEDALMKRIATLTPANTESELKVSFSFASSDTENILPGKYYYEIKLERKESPNDPTRVPEVRTLQGKKIFYII